MEAGEAGAADSPAQSTEAEPEREVSGAPVVELVAPRAQIEAISSGTEGRYQYNYNTATSQLPKANWYQGTQWKISVDLSLPLVYYCEALH